MFPRLSREDMTGVVAEIIAKAFKWSDSDFMHP